MEEPAEGEVARLLEAVEEGDRAAFDALFTLLYEELRTLAHRERRRRQGPNSLNTTALVHEAYLKLVDRTRRSWESRAHFAATAAKAMRHILVDYARARGRQKRGGGRPKLSIDEFGEQVAGGTIPGPGGAELLVAFDAALTELERLNERQSRIVECRCFGGMTIVETAEALGVSPATVSRGWAVAKARLHRALSEVA